MHSLVSLDARIMPDIVHVKRVHVSEFVINGSGELPSGPYIVQGVTSMAPFGNWSINKLSELKGKETLSFKVGAVGKYEMETECHYIEETLENFEKWIEGSSDCGEFTTVPRANYWLYADYKGLDTVFSEEKYQELWESINWGIIGMPEKGARDSTLWICSGGAFTPCHYDTYGVNYYCVISGEKEWLMYPPQDSTCLYPTRIPYEESSVYSSVNMFQPDFHRHPAFTNATPYKATLQSGDMLYVPRHWWHFVYSNVPTLSINIWLDTEQDKKERLKEAIAKMMVCCWKLCEQNSSITKWLNPNEGLPQFSDLVENIRLSAAELYPEARDHLESLSSDQLLNMFVSNNVLESIISVAFSK